MKRYLPGLLAIVVAIGLSSFTIAKHSKNTTTYYWFDITAEYAPAAAVASADAVFITTSTTPPSNGCAGGSDQCVSGFLSSDVIVPQSGDPYLKDDLQIADETSSRQNF